MERKQNAANIRIYARLAEVLIMNCGACFSSSSGLKKLY